MKTISIEIPDYNPLKGIQRIWESNYEIETELHDKSFIIKANKEGLCSLAYQLLTLADLPAETGNHLHYDDINSLEEGSIELIIERIR